MWKNLEEDREGFTTQRVVPTRPFRYGVDVTTFQHTSIASLLGDGTITQEWLGKQFIYAWVRNTWARLVSVFFHLEQGRPDQQAVIAQEAPTFERFIERAAAGDIPPIGRASMNGLSYANRQTDWMRLPTDNGTMWLPEFVGRVERIDKDWTRLCEQLGIRPRSVGHTNPSNHKPYQYYYTRRLKRLVGKRYAEEIDLFKYGF